MRLPQFIIRFQAFLVPPPTFSVPFQQILPISCSYNMMPSSRVTPTLLNAAQTPSQSDSAQVTQQGSDNGAGTARRQYHSASPQLHHFLKVTPPATVNDQAQHRARNTPSATRHLRRHSSTDLDLQNAKSAFDGLAGHRDPDKDRKRAATLSLGSAQSRPTLHIPGSTLPANFTVGNSIIRESSREDEDIAEQLASGHDVRLRERDTTTMDTSNLLIRRSLYTNEESIPTTIYREPWRDVHSGKTRAQSPTARSSSSTSSSRHSDASSDKTANTEVTIPIDGPDGEETPIAPVTINGDAGASARHRRHRSWTIDADRYGTPEMPRGTAKLPHIPASILTPRIPNQSHPKHLPRAEKLPMSGYELVASSISSSATPNRLSTFLGSSSGPSHRHSSRRNSTTSHTSARSGAHEEDITIKPLYRRFEALNHRILLHLQDELSELEEQLHRLDTTDTQTRRLQNRILPASRRAEYLSGGELQWHKTDILEKIGFKLGQYSTFLISPPLPIRHSPTPIFFYEKKKKIMYVTNLMICRPRDVLICIHPRPSSAFDIRYQPVPQLPLNPSAHHRSRDTLPRHGRRPRHPRRRGY